MQKEDMAFSHLVRDGDIWLWIDPTFYTPLTPYDDDDHDLCILPLLEGFSEEFTAVTLRSQLRRAFKRDEHTDTFLAYDLDIQAVTKCPVLLASVQPYPHATTQVDRQSPYPPPEHGTAALVAGKQKYYIADLPKQAQKRQRHISQMLEEHDAAQPEQIRTTYGTSCPVFQPCPEELWNMIQQLAQDYYQHHQSQAQKKRAIPHTPTLFEHGVTNTSSCLPIQAVIAGIHNAKSVATQWQNPEGHAPFFHYAKPKGSAIVEYKTGEKNEVFDDKTTASLWRQVKNFSDDDADVVLALFAHLIRPSENDGTTWFLAAQFLDYRGVKPRMQADAPGGKKRRAGHRQEDIKAVGDSIGRIENIWITLHQWVDETASGKKKRKRTEFTHKGRLLMVEEAYTQRELPDGDIEGDPGMEIGWRIRPGSWLRTFLENPNRQVANLCQKALQYDPYRQQWEKRLSRYFMFHGHINTHGGGGVFNREISKLLQELSLEANQRDPQRTKNRFEKAMNTLVEDKIIQEWCYTEDVSLPAKGWLPTWLEQKITVHIASTRGLAKG